jgi:dipeptidyl aminopeptidase/acylaminoacyl peptidase
MLQLPGIVLVASACGAGRLPEVREVPQYSLERFLGTTNLMGSSFSPDGTTILVSSDETGIFNAFAVPVSGDSPLRLTDSTGDAVPALGYFPADERILYASDRDGDERGHIYVRDPDGTTRELTPGADLTAQFMGWAQDDRGFFFLSNERDQRYFDLYEMAAADYERALLYRNDGGHEIAAISPDRRYLALGRRISTNSREILLYDRQTAELRSITPATARNVAIAFSHDGAGLYFISNEGSEFDYLVRYDLAGGERETIFATDWDVMFAQLSRSGKYLVVRINRDARTDIQVIDVASGEALPLPHLPKGNISFVTISRDERHLAFHVNSGRSPRNLYVLDLNTGTPRQLTEALDPGIAAENLVEPEVVRFASYDGVEIPGLLYRPHDASPNARVPALIWSHGGPGGQARIGYNPLIQYLVNHGYAIYEINYRGSYGYGKTFVSLDDRKHGQADLGDIVASKAMLSGTGFIDPVRIGVVGESHGGYLTMGALAFHPDEFRVGVDLFGVISWLRILEDLPPSWESMRGSLYAELGDPATDRERLRRVTPLLHADRITAPFIALRGANDPLFLPSEMDSLVSTARTNGVPVEYLLFPDEGHGLARRENQLRGYDAILEFLDRHLKSRGAGAPAT